MPTRFYYRLSNNIRITVRPQFLPERSQPAVPEFVFAYHVRIENVGERSAQLLRRRWQIHDSIGEDQVVEGEGVVGQQPVIPPGGVHEYQSFCVLRSPAGHMEGQYFFEGDDGRAFAAEIPRFLLDARAATGPMH
jgi:ApaG protein